MVPGSSPGGPTGRQAVATRRGSNDRAGDHRTGATGGAPEKGWGKVTRIEMLVRLQELDLGRDDLVRERDSGPARLEAARAPLTSARSAERLARERTQEATRARERLEKEIEFERSKLDERDRKLRQVKTNEEFQAGQKELTEQRKRITAMEDTVLKFMETVEALQREIDDAIASAEAVRGDVEAIEREVIARTSALDEKIAAVDHDAMALRHGLDRGLLSHYDIVRARRGGAAVAEVKGGICQGCRTRIPAQMYNELHAPDAQNICPSCNRIIYVNLSPKVAGDDAGRAELQ